MYSEGRGIPQSELGIEKERGVDTSARFTFVRHSQKASAEVFGSGGGLSGSALSESGKERAGQYGTEELVDRKFDKAYATQSDRTRETLESALASADLEPKLLQKSEDTNSFFSLPQFSGSEKFMDRYGGILDEERTRILTEEFEGKKLSELNPDEQEYVMELAEEPAIEWYLAFADEKPDDETPSPREQASKVAWKINRLVHIVDFMKSGKDVDLISAGHKTSTEAFLKFVIEREDGVGFEKLEDIGGSLKIMDGWELAVSNDSEGEKRITLSIRRENGDKMDYGVSEQALKKLSDEYIEKNNLQKKRIDSGLV